MNWFVVVVVVFLYYFIFHNYSWIWNSSKREPDKICFTYINIICCWLNFVFFFFLFSRFVALYNINLYIYIYMYINVIHALNKAFMQYATVTIGCGAGQMLKWPLKLMVAYQLLLLLVLFVATILDWPLWKLSQTFSILLHDFPAMPCHHLQ